MGDVRRKPGFFDVTERSSTNLSWPGYLGRYYFSGILSFSLQTWFSPKDLYLFFSFHSSDYFPSLIFFSLSPCFKFNLPISPQYSSFSLTGGDMKQR